MTGKADRRFWKAFEKLPASVQRLAREKYALWKHDPYHPSLQFEERRNGVCVVRIFLSRRAEKFLASLRDAKLYSRLRTSIFVLGD